MMLERELDPNELHAPQSRIPRVPDSLRKNEKHAEMFDPAVVAIGPYHRGKPHLSAMEDHKKEAAKAFAKPNGHALYRKVTEIVAQCRDCYGGDDDDDGRLRLMNDEDFACMLFVDGCFVLEFIYMFVKNDFTEFTVRAHLHGLILRDIFLLENQLPYLLLKKLMEVKSVPIYEFLDRVAGTQGQRRKMGKESSSTKSTNEQQQHPHPHPHLLAQFRERHLGPADDETSTQLARGSSEQSFRSAKELVEAGIKIRRGNTSFLRDVTFRPCLVWGKLSLPRIVVDDLTRSRLLNMIALEMSAGGGGGDYGVTSFVWFMDLLIYSADDVKELRQAGVLQNLLGRDEHLAELFNDIAKDLVPDQKAYHGVMKSINRYYKFKLRVILNQVLRTRLGLILVLTVLATIFTVIQTFFTIYPPACQVAK
uniref:Uncharacterized protein n=1 Tax=Ananas comosus var. bracteatus TaxID=296719 RepID=A0A6V7PCQ2_ANACO|nr:unnamed protein product [Ananas comosus var. bracteatus]